MSFRSTATNVAAALLLLKLVAKGNSRARFYINAFLYMCGIGVSSMVGIVVSTFLSLIPRQRFNTNFIVARTFYSWGRLMWGTRIKLEGKEHLSTCPAVVLANHQSTFDIFFLGRVFPTRTVVMAKKELTYVPLMGQFMLLSGDIFIERNKRQSALETMRQVGETMKRNQISLFMFPEGTRSGLDRPDMLPFKKGAFHLAVQSQLPILPIVCENYHHLFDSKTRFDLGDLTAVVLPPVSTVGKTEADIPELMEQVRNDMVAKLRELDSRRHGNNNNNDKAITAPVEKPKPRGVAPEDAHLYAPNAEGKWKCLNSDVVIGVDEINNDYCDCPDGSDEPGTSACPDSRFYCANKGHIPAYIFSSHVDDGLCDPDCCDGSDEVLSGKKCPNVCAKRHAEYKRAKDAADKIHNAGARVRDSYIAKAKLERETVAKDIIRRQAELAEAKVKEEQLRAVRELAEKHYEDRRAAQEASPLYAALDQRRTAIEELENGRTLLLGEIRKLANLLAELAEQGTPEEHSPVAEFIKWRDGPSGEHMEVSDRLAVLTQKSNSEAAYEIKHDDLHDILDKQDQAVVSSQLFSIPDYLPDSLIPLYKRASTVLVDVLIRLQIITPGRVTEGASVDVEEARLEHDSAQDEINRIEADIQRLERKQYDPARYGIDGEFQPLDGECISKDMGDYTYEFCFLGNTKQISNRDKFPFTLGRFNHFDIHGEYPETDYAHYKNMLYDRGQKCWNGPQRSTLVELECGEKNELLDVSEAEKCVYSMRVSTPAVCSPRESNTVNVAHDEL
ncbi:hypothetical protein MCUN1_002068 [Malassezia cuniculi]|uniref:1-acyl-sn-glycerol-3-phosphate acyltransferase n=1 Tax=Malassezia cuniculi TaxID=948313 RepID=A0AAF0J6H0_9BASI|nr:hypothetical protein MCUN1_002068 [Malassezia cuniculi]